MLVDPPALRAGFLLPAGDGALIEVEGDDNSLHRTAVGKQRHDCEHQPPRLVHPVEGGVFGLGEGPTTAFAAITALFVAMDHEVALSRTTVGAAAPVVTELLVRVHADTHPFFGGQRPKKDAAGPAYSSTQPSSTLPWGATEVAGKGKNLYVFCPESHDDGPGDLSARTFANDLGVPEDPATGSAAGCLAAYLLEHVYLGTDSVDVRVEQGYEIDRPSLLYLHTARDGDEIRVDVGGKVQMVARAELV